MLKKYSNLLQVYCRQIVYQDEEELHVYKEVEFEIGN